MTDTDDTVRAGEVDVLDAHVHLWDPRTTPRTVSPLVRTLGWAPRWMDRVARLVVPRAPLDFVGATDHVVAPFLPATWRRGVGARRVRGFVHVEADWMGRGPLALADETRWLETLDERPLAIVGGVHLADPDAGALLDAHRHASPRFRGVRDKLAFSDARGVHSWTKRGDLMRTGAFRRGYEALGARGLSFDAFVYHTQLTDLAQLAEDYPDTPLVLDHMGTPIALAGPFGGLGQTAQARRDVEAAWHDGLARLAECPHVHVKLSGFGMPIVGWGFHQRAAPPDVGEVVERLGPHVRFVIERFGPDRCLFASNFPMDSVSFAYGTWLDAFTAITADLGAATQRKLLLDTAARFYRVPSPSA